MAAWVNNVIDLGQAFGLRMKPFASLNTPDFVGPTLGMTITDVQDKFPETYYVLSTDLGWSNADILDRTYFTLCYLEAGFKGYDLGTGFAFGQRGIKIPAGKWYYNSELRTQQGTVSGDGGGYGITVLQEEATGWKSIYGAQNNGTRLGICPITYAGEAGTSANPIQLGGGYEWCHNVRVENLCMRGTSASLFNNNAVRSSGFNYWNPGENSGFFNCLFEEYNDFGVLMSGYPAYANGGECSFFRNAVGGIGIRGCARAEMNMSFSGDFNPWAIFMFRQGTTLLSPNGVSYWPDFLNINPGGNLQLQYCKLEAFACRSGFQGYSTCTPDVPGKGQMLARLTGRFHFGCDGGVATVHNGKVNTLIQVADDYYQNGMLPGQVPLANSSIDIRNYGTINFAYWLHDCQRGPLGGKKWVANINDTDTHGNGFTWRADQNSGNCYDVTNPSIMLGQVAATYNGRQPFINNTAPLAGGWNEAAGPGGMGSPSGYDVVTGVAYPP